MAKTDRKFKEHRARQNQFLIFRPRVLPEVSLAVEEPIPVKNTRRRVGEISKKSASDKNLDEDLEDSIEHQKSRIVVQGVAEHEHNRAEGGMRSRYNAVKHYWSK